MRFIYFCSGEKSSFIIEPSTLVWNRKDNDSIRLVSEKQSSFSFLLPYGLLSAQVPLAIGCREASSTFSDTGKRLVPG